MLGSVEAENTTIVADFEAGIGTLTRLGDEPVDIVVVVVEPSAKSLDVGVRAAELASIRSDGRVVVVANKVASEADVHAVRRSFPGAEVVAVPDDESVAAADRRGHSPVDHDPGCSAVVALESLAQQLAS